MNQIFKMTKHKLLLLPILIICSGFTTSQKVNTVRVTINVQDATLVQIFDKITKETEFNFTYGELIAKNNTKYDAAYDNIFLNNILQDLGKRAHLDFKVVDTEIMVAQKIKKLETDKSVIQQMAVNGKVTDINGLPLLGASITEKGTTNGTTTNFDGRFNITVTNSNAVLIASYIGYKTEEIAIEGQNDINFTLVEDTSKLDEVVLIGYGKQSKENVTGAISSVKANEIQEFPSTSVEQSLLGRIPGVQISQNSGQPGAGISIRVRGLASISGGNEPLYVVDGVPFFSNNVRFLNGLSSINPNDIESIEVLKDASATAIYGSRGSNGVIIITTKSGTKDAKSTISYNTWAGIRTIRQKIDLMNGDQFLEFQNNFYSNSGLDIPDEVAGIQNANTDWQDEVFRTALATNHDISFSGGSDKSNYFVSLNYLSEEGIVLNSDFERFSFRTNLNNELNKTFAIKSSFTFSNAEQNGFREAENNNTTSFITSGIGSTLQALSTEPVFNEDGTYVTNVSPYDFSQDVRNPVGLAKQVLDKVTIRRLLGSFTLESSINENLINYTRLGVDYSNIRNDQYIPTTILNSTGDAGVLTSENFNYLFENYLEYKYEIFPGLDFKAVLGGSLQKESTKTIVLGASEFFTDDLLNNAIQAGGSINVPTTNNIDQSIASAFARVNIIFKNKYLFEGSIRSDGASVFSQNNKVATFPAFSAGWKLSEESFIKEISNISNLKIRASWGKTGNQGIQPYQSLPLGVIVIGSQGAGTGLATGLAPNLPNENLTWETTTQTNIGLDLGLFKNRFNLSLDYYLKDTRDALTQVQLQPSSGFATIVDNVGSIENRGLELALNGVLIDKKDLSLNIDFNISYNKNEVTALNEGEDIVSEFTFAQVADAVGGVSSVARVGEPIGAFLGFKFAGFDENGVPQYEDLNNDGSLTDEDKAVIGNPIPKILYGFNTNLTYKNFSFRTNWQGVADVDILNLGRFNLTSPDNFYNRSNDIYDFYPNVNESSEHRMSDRYVEKGSFLRLRNIELGYSFTLDSNSFLQSLGFYISAQNLLTITDYSGFDPDVNSLSGNDIKQGVDLAAYPTTKSFTIGLTASF